MNGQLPISEIEEPSYGCCTFSVRSKYLVNSEDFVCVEHLPSFVHEFMHYIQEVSHVSSIMGYCTFLYDISALSKYYTSLDVHRATIPLNSNTIESHHITSRKAWIAREGYNRDRHFTWGMFDGWRVEQAELFGYKYNRIIIRNMLDQEFHFGLYPINELHSYYAQMAVKQEVFRNKSDDHGNRSDSMLAEYIDKDIFGQLPIEYSYIDKFRVIDLCLDTAFPEEVIFNFINQAMSMSMDELVIDKALIIIKQISNASELSKEDIFKEIIPALEEVESSFRTNKEDKLAASIEWYRGMILAMKLIRDTDPSLFSKALHNFSNLKKLIEKFPPPIMILDTEHGEELVQCGNEDIHSISFRSALSLYSLFHLYKVLTSPDKKSFMNLGKCPFYPKNRINAGPCIEVISQPPEITYQCYTAHWDRIQNKYDNRPCCLMTDAYASIGLLRHNIEVDDSIC